jgi:hypothetical protein
MKRYGSVIGLKREAIEEYKAYRCSLAGSVGDDPKMQHPQLFHLL